jgi:hypothetical protein
MEVNIRSAFGQNPLPELMACQHRHFVPAIG